MTYSKNTWANYPATSTPITAERLNHLETQYDESTQYTDSEISALSGLISTDLSSKANLSGGKVPLTELPTSTSATTNTLPVRSTSGRIPGVGTPSSGTDAANKTYVDNAPKGFLFGTSGQNVQFLGGCLRRNSAGTAWEFLDDAGHTPIGISAVSVVGGTRIRVTYNFTATKVITFSVTPDEAFAGAGQVLKMGPSVGLTYADIYLYYGVTTTTPTDPLSLSTPGANLWVSGVFLV